MDRITEKHLTGSCETLNIVLGLPTEYGEHGHIWTQGTNGYVNVMQQEGRGARTLSVGNTKRQAWEWLGAAIAGAQMMKESLNNKGEQK